MKLVDATKFLSDLNDEEKQITYSLISYSDQFSVDWFSEFPYSKLYAMINKIENQGWISPAQDNYGYYAWSSEFPRLEVIEQIPSEEMAKYYRLSEERLLKLFPTDEEVSLALGRQRLLIGLREEDLNVIASAALIEEKRNRIAPAIHFYETILNFVEKLIASNEHLAETTWDIFIYAIERRACLSLFYPELKDVERFLDIALTHALKLGNLKTQAHLELLIGQNHWMFFQHRKAIEHFNRGLEIISTIDDSELHKKGLKIRGLIHASSGRFLDAITSYERSLGELETVDNNDFFLVAALGLAHCYTQVGMPQRGLGITESIQKYSQKNENSPLLTFALITAAMILLDIGNLSESRMYFEKASILASNENLPMLELLSGMGLAAISCKEGDYSRAKQHYTPRLKVKRSNWYVVLNFFPLFETPYLIYAKGYFDEIEHFFDFLRNIQPSDVNPFGYAIIQRSQFLLPLNKSSNTEKIQTLRSLEEAVEKMGASFEVALIRIDLARLFSQENDLQKAKDYATKAWSFLQPIAKNRFPSDLQYLISEDKLLKENDIANLIIEMSEALVTQENIETLLTNAISSIDRLLGSERTAIFIKDEKSSDLKIVASRNLFVDNIQDEKFRQCLELLKSAVDSKDSKITRYELYFNDSLDKRQAIVMPLKLSNRAIGVLYTEGRNLNIDLESHDDNIKYLNVVASQIALSIDRALAYDEVVRLNRKLLLENSYYIESLEEIRPFAGIVGTSKTIMEVQALIRKVAPAQSTVLIYGETGVGKELVARAIHRESLRNNGPFIRVNCAALPDTLIDSELFGHEKGAFTGATQAKQGRFELANNGTIFLDEISELPPSTQSRLLRILQEKEFQRVGGTKTLHSNFRLIVATNKYLDVEVAGGRFRNDLFYRLNVFPIYVPPLRERTEDIPLLATHFFKFYCNQNSKKFTGISEAEMEKLKNYSWPGNIRELSNMVELAVIMGESKIRFPKLNEKAPIIHKGPSCLNVSLKNQEKELIIDALEKCGGKISGPSGAAALLGMNRSTLRYHIKKLRIKTSYMYD